MKRILIKLFRPIVTAIIAEGLNVDLRVNGHITSSKNIWAYSTNCDHLKKRS